MKVSPKALIQAKKMAADLEAALTHHRTSTAVTAQCRSPHTELAVDDSTLSERNLHMIFKSYARVSAS